MGEIFDRIKSIKIKRQTLVISLIATEIFGILVLVWFLRIPLSQKFLSSPPKAYSLSQMNTQKRYIASQGDYLTDKTNSKTIVILVREDEQILGKTKIKPNPQGVWSYQIPSNLSSGVKIITVGGLDDQNKVTTVKDYKIRIINNSLLEQNKLLKSIFLLFNKTIQTPTPGGAQDLKTNKIFYADFEYDNKNKYLLQTAEGSKSGQLRRQLFTYPPASKSGSLNYKIEVRDNDNQIIRTGWDYMRPNGQGLYILKLEIEYLKNSLISVYLDGQVLWKKVLN